MKVTQDNHDSLSVGLSAMINRLFLGERLLLSALAMEFGVHERTIYRDLHERLGCLDIVRENKHYCLSQNQLGSVDGYSSVKSDPSMTSSCFQAAYKSDYVDQIYNQPVMNFINQVTR